MNSVNKYITGIAGDERCRFRPLKGGGLRMVMRLTARCNLSCPHCLAAGKKDYDELDTGQWIGLIKQFPDIGVKKALLTGGEPLLRPDITAIAEALAREGIQTDLNSNLQLMDSGLIRELKHAGLSEISASLEGPEEIHDRMHGNGGAYSKLINAIALAVENGIPVDLSCCLTMENYKFIQDLIKTAETLSARSLTFSRLLPIGHGVASRQSLTQAHLNDCYRTIENEITSGRPHISIRVTGLLGAPVEKDCRRGDSLAAITPDGNLLGCVLTDDNPCIPHPLEAGMRRAFNSLREELAKRQYALCWHGGLHE